MPDSAAVIAARLDRLPMARRLWAIVLAVSLGGAFEFYDLLFTAYVGPGMVRAGLFTREALQPLGFLYDLFGGGPATFVFATFFGLFLGTLLFAPLADRFGRRRAFVGALVWYSATTLVLAFQRTGFWIDLWRFVCGLGLGVQMITIAAYLSELTPRRFRGRVFAVSQGVQFCGVPAAAFAAWAFSRTPALGLDGWRWVMILGALGAVAMLLVLRKIPESPRWLARHGRLDEADAVTAEIEAAVARDTGATLPPPKPGLEETGEAGFAALWRPPHRGRVVLLSVFNAFQAIGFYGFAAWVPTLLVARGVTVTTSLGYAFVIAVANPVGPLIGYAVADRLERKHQIMIAATSVALVGLVFSRLSAPALLTVCGVLITLGSNWMSFAFHNYQAELFPTRIRARAVGFVYAWSRLSAALSGLMVGLLLKAGGAGAVFALIAFAMAVVVAAIGLFGPRTRGRALETI